jgi:hypothetical protein
MFAERLVRDKEAYMNESRVTGWWVFAAIILMMVGVLNLIWGIAAISDSKFFGQGNNVYILSGLHTWGWLTLILGVIQLFAAFSLFSGGGFGRVIGIIAAALGALAALGTTGSTPFWSLGVFALAVTVVYQLVKAPEVGA